jgi:hypothetical protein
LPVVGLAVVIGDYPPLVTAAGSMSHGLVVVRRAKSEQIEKLQVNTLKWPVGALSKPATDTSEW